MNLLTSIRDLCMDFLFPQSPKILELQALSTSELAKILPPADMQKEKETLAVFDYSHPLVKEMIWELKYKGNTKIADKLGEILYDHIQQELVDLSLFENWSKPLLIPVPISDKRRFERGWNQSELLAQKIMDYDRNKMFVYLPRQLIKYRHTESQTKTSSRKERLENITNSMKVLNTSKMAGECVVVVDDVTTTGSTFAEARRALFTAGARKILCVAVAH